MEIVISVLQFIVCASVIVVAGTYLARAADEIADITKFGRLLIGSVLLAGATSLPELTVDISAIRMGAPDLAIGDLFGSCLANLLILAVLDLMQRSSGGMLSRRAARHALSGGMSGAMICVAGLTLLTAPLTEHWNILGIGPGLWLLALIYVGGIRIVYLDQRVAATEAVASPQHVDEPTGSIQAAIARFVGCALVILVVGPFMAHAAEKFAAATGIGRTFVGTTMVALSTSLPEFVASLAAVRMGAYDLAIGNVFGSNAFNMFLLVPLDVAHSGALMASVSASHGITCLSAILATQTAIMGQLYNVEGRRRFIDLDAWLVIGIVLVGLALVYYSA